MIISPTDLTYFVEIAQTLNISRAAERLGISQPSLSVAVQRLEHELGTPLLTRSKKGVSLTQAGKQFLKHSASLLQSWSDVKAKTLASVEKVQGSFTIGCHVSIALNLLSEFLPEIINKYPDLSLHLKHDLSRNIAEDVISMKIDMGIVVNPVMHPDLIIHPLYQGEITFWTMADNHCTVKSLKNKPAVLVVDPNLMRTQMLINECQKKGIVFERILYSDNIEVVAELISKGCGIGILPVNAAMRMSDKLRRIDDMPAFYDDHCLLYRVENKNVKSVQMLSEKLREHTRLKIDKLSGFKPIQ